MIPINKLGLKPHKKTTRFNLKKSIRKFFKISAMSHFNANFSLFSNCNLLKKTFNNSIQIKKLLKKKYKIHQSGFIFKAQLKKRNQVHYKDIFVKECPILNPLELDIDLNFVKIKKIDVGTKKDLFTSYRLDFSVRKKLNLFKKKYKNILL